ncbi:mannan-binding lectin serine protease 1-like isoform X3 [Acipenser ruthenus]|uniref:mannan-binding lectin serine protease 1-like isoform X3 n=1 Tax=Acipenser ruthenus TaxID=7906 RepID=UPI002741F27F|nr:mannan-binding lectin serine protease 1-like isoform X3 [Acipenser ruthenus]
MRSLTLLALYIFMPQSGAVELTEMYGSIQSPNFPDSYPKNSEVSWNITVPEGFKIKLYFMHFDLEPSYLCEYDYVKIEAEQELLVIFCGRENTDTEQIPGEQVIMSPENSLSVSFRSDFSNEERFTGFEAHYTAVDVDECTERNDEELACDHYCHNYIGGYYCSCRFGYILHSDNRTCRVECSDNLFIERTGVITSSDFPNPYPKSSDCLYRIELQEGFMISLEFDDSFDIEDHPEVTCPYDYLKIKAGRREFGPLCGERSPGRIETGSNSVQILFHSDNSGESRGWKLSYTAVGNPCPVPQPPKNGKIEPVLAQYSFKDQVLITCDTGYNVLKDDIEAEHYQIECRKEGTWSSNVPVCKIVDCGAPVELEHGSVSSDSGDNLTIFGSSIQYSCQGPRYHMYPAINNSTYICGEKGLWVNEELGSKRPSCMAVCGAPQFSRVKRQRVANGHSATRGVSPWIAMLSRNGQPFCGGSLIGNKWIVTAAHCLLDPLHSGNPVPVTVSAASFQIILGDMMIVSGWGKQFLRRLPDSLMEIEIPIANQELCKTSYKSLNGKVTDDMLCAGEKEGGKDACQGDSGGPMVTLNRHTGRWFLAAVVSWGDGCGVSGRFGVYSNVVRSLSWIRNITGVENV